jgi:spermidine synthase
MVPTPSVFAALAVVTAIALAQQVAFTRLLAAVLPYHFGFLAISLSMLGTGAAALRLYIEPAWIGSDPARFLARWTATLAISLVLLPIGLARVDIAGVPIGWEFAFQLGCVCVLGALPALAAGFVVAAAIASYTRQIAAVYAADLVGAGVGALVVVPLLDLVPAPALVVLLGAVAALAAVVVAPAKSKLRLVSAAIFVASLGVYGAGRSTRLLYLDHGYSQAVAAFQVSEHWTALGRHFGFVVPSTDPKAPSAQPKAYLFYDRVYAPIPAAGGVEAPGYRALGTGPQSVGFALTEPGRALIIGGGGGRDIYNALSSGQTEVHVVELLDGNRRVVDEDLKTFSGAPYSRPRVKTTIGDGRSVLAATGELYDHIHIGFTDTLSANAAQGFALTENGLYTVEAFDEYFDHLKPRGILNVTRLLKLVGDEALRVTVLTLAALERRGVKDPFRNVVVVFGMETFNSPTGTVLARLEPFSDAEVETIKKLATERAHGVLMAPGTPSMGEWGKLAQAPSIHDFCQSYPLDVCPPTDDRPFFFDMGRIGAFGKLGSAGYLYDSPITILLLTLGLLTALSAVAMGSPLAYVPRAEWPALRTLVMFFCLGLGYLFLEIALLQRFSLFLGFPTYALSVVLFALLVFSGVGAFLSARFADHEHGLGRVLGAATVLTAASSVGLPPILSASIGAPFPVRAVIAIVLIAPVGVCLGAAMPISLHRLALAKPGHVPYAWGANGVASVLATVVGTFIAVKLGITALCLAASAAYAVAFAAGRRAEPGSSHPVGIASP